MVRKRRRPPLDPPSLFDRQLLDTFETLSDRAAADRRHGQGLPPGPRPDYPPTPTPPAVPPRRYRRHRTGL